MGSRLATTHFSWPTTFGCSAAGSRCHREVKEVAVQGGLFGAI